MTPDIKKKPSALPVILFWCSLGAGILFSAVQTVLYLRYFEEEAYAYTYGIVYPTILHWSMAAVTAILLVASLAAGKNCVGRQLAEPNRSITFFALLCGFFFAASVLMRLVYGVSGISAKMSIWEIIVLVCAVPSAAYFLMTALSRTPNRIAITVAGFFPVLWCILNAFILYFDTATPHTSPVRRILYVVLAGLMLYLVAELRYHMDMGNARQYFVTGICAMPVLIAAPLSNTVMVAIGKRDVGPDSVFCFILFCMTAYLCARLYSAVSSYADRHPVIYADMQNNAEEKPEQSEETNHEI